VNCCDIDGGSLGTQLGAAREEREMSVVRAGLSWMWMGLVACSGEKDDGGPVVGDSTASFDVTGTWSGTAVDDDTSLAVTLELDNNGGEYGMDLAGTLTLGDLGTFPFSASYIDVTPGPMRVSNIEAVDDAGFTYELRGTFTEQRMDDGQLLSSNPEADVDVLFLDTTLEKQ
jgi:hypothetical protein